MSECHTIILFIAPKHLPDAIILAEALDIIAVQHQAIHTEATYKHCPGKDVRLANLVYTASFKNKRQSRKFMTSDFVLNSEQYHSFLLQNKNDRDILFLIGTALETMREFPELSQEIIILPYTSEEKGHLYLYSKSRETLDAFLSVFPQILAAPKRPDYNDMTAQLLQAMGFTI